MGYGVFNPLAHDYCKWQPAGFYIPANTVLKFVEVIRFIDVLYISTSESAPKVMDRPVEVGDLPGESNH